MTKNCLKWIFFACICIAGNACRQSTSSRSDTPAVHLPDPYQGRRASCRSSATQKFIDRLNRMRANGGAPEVRCLPELDRLAAAHANYLHLNPDLALEHNQIPERPGFVGVTVGDRALNMGIAASSFWVSESLGSGEEPLDTLRRHLGSVYHRSPLLSPGSRYIALADPVINVLTTASPERERLLIFPGRGAQDVPLSFNTDGEHPDPDRQRSRVGYPISYHFARRLINKTGAEHVVKIHRSEIQVSGELIAHRVLTQTTDRDVSPADGFLVPEEPLISGTRYSVTVHLSYGPKEHHLAHDFVTQDGDSE